jgi:hypothetical protein
MALFDSTWERVRVAATPGKLRVALMLISLVAMVLGGAADEHWS